MKKLPTQAIAQMDELLPEALAVTRQMQAEYNRARVLRALVPHLPEALLPEALETIRQIQDRYHWATAMQGMIPRLMSIAIDVQLLV